MINLIHLLVKDHTLLPLAGGSLLHFTRAHDPLDATALILEAGIIPFIFIGFKLPIVFQFYIWMVSHQSLSTHVFVKLVYSLNRVEMVVNGREHWGSNVLVRRL